MDGIVILIIAISIGLYYTNSEKSEKRELVVSAPADLVVAINEDLSHDENAFMYLFDEVIK